MRRLWQVRPQDETAGATAPQPAAWFLRGRLYSLLFVQLIAYLHCYNSCRTHVNYIYGGYNCEYHTIAEYT